MSYATKFEFYILRFDDDIHLMFGALTAAAVAADAVACYIMLLILIQFLLAHTDKQLLKTNLNYDRKIVDVPFNN